MAVPAGKGAKTRFRDKIREAFALFVPFFLA
jgi:hypothetical protein